MPRMDAAARAALRRLARLALREDLGRGGDLTTRHFVPRGARFQGFVVARGPGVLCGLEAAREVLRLACPAARFLPLSRDGRRVRRGQRLARVEGPRCVLTAERVALNFLQRLSGVATLARAYADRLRGTRARLYDTRKTLPGWRALEKYAVRCGGGRNHRMGLYDAALLKDNHWAWAGPDLERRARYFKARRRVPLIFEAKTRAQIERALRCGADVVLLDNMPPSRLRREIRFLRRASPRTRVEASGGVTLANIRAVARLGPDRISVGRVTHSAPALDMSLELRRAR